MMRIITMKTMMEWLRGQVPTSILKPLLHSKLSKCLRGFNSLDLPLKDLTDKQDRLRLVQGQALTRLDSQPLLPIWGLNQLLITDCRLRSWAQMSDLWMIITHKSFQVLAPINNRQSQNKFRRNLGANRESSVQQRNVLCSLKPFKHQVQASTNLNVLWLS